MRSSFFQSVCVLGYCVFPLLVSAFFCLILSMCGATNVLVRVALVLVGFVWATRGMMNYHSIVSFRGVKARQTPGSIGLIGTCAAELNLCGNPTTVVRTAGVSVVFGLRPGGAVPILSRSSSSSCGVIFLLDLLQL